MLRVLGLSLEILWDSSRNKSALVQEGNSPRRNKEVDEVVKIKSSYVLWFNGSYLEIRKKNYLNSKNSKIFSLNKKLF